MLAFSIDYYGIFFGATQSVELFCTYFIFSVTIEMLQLLLRLGTFQVSDIVYNTFGGMLGGLMYCAVMKARKRL